MKTLFSAMHKKLLAGQNIMFVSIIESIGSVPAGPSAHMLVDENGRFCGTIGGGAIEHKAEIVAVAALQKGESTLHTYTLRHSDAGDIGMVCGGDVTVYSAFLTADEKTAAFAGRAALAFDEDTAVWLLFTVGKNAFAMAMANENGVFALTDSSCENPLASLPKKSIARFLASAPLLHELDSADIYSEPLVFPGRVVIFGGGHVAQALVPVLAGVGFRVVVFDDRPEFTNPTLFPGAASTTLGNFSDIAASLTLTAYDWIVVLTHGHAGDFEVQKQVLLKTYPYVGIIGSRAKTASVNARLQKEGIPKEALQTVHTPIGLAIGAKTPAEIAISIAAELIALRAGHDIMR